MFQGGIPQTDFVYFEKKNEKPQIFTERPYTQKTKDAFRKAHLQLLLMYIFPLKSKLSS